ncbi:endothelin-converting enzyme 1-like [Ornithodoros turicata]|uniref:endothelin-converting enzyme 1-like n=1 Tax=Ornithodoros turicata TaxID=34597 RepID=UPI0031390EAD
MADSGAFDVFQEPTVTASDTSTKERTEPSHLDCSKTGIVVVLCIVIVLALALAALILVFTRNAEQSTPGEAGMEPTRKSITLPKLRPGSSEYVTDDYTDDDVPETTRQEPAEGTTPLKESGKVCDTDDCGFIREYIGALLDTDQDPCGNFFSFVCGKADRLRETGMYIDPAATEIMGELNLTRAILKSLRTEKIPRNGKTAFQQAAALYQHCEDDDSETSARVIRDFLAEHHMDLAGSLSFDPIDITVKFIFEIDICPIFCMNYFGSQGRNYFELEFANVALVTNEDYVNDTLSSVYSAKLPPIAENITEATHNIFLLPTPYDQKEEDRVFELWRIGLENEDEALSKVWTEALQRYTTSRALQNLTIHMSPYSFIYFHSFFGARRSLSADDIMLFYAWNTLLFLHRISVGPEKACDEIIVQYMPNAAGSAVVSHLLERTRMKGVIEMIQEIISEVEKSLRTTLLLDEETRAGALKKLSMLEIRTGLAPKLNTSEKLNKFYENLPDLNGPYLWDVLNVSAYRNQKRWKHALNGFHEFYVGWETDTSRPYTSNAFYRPLLNHVTFLVPMMLKPNFNLGAPPEINYGALGSTVIHEIMHGFDTYGRQYDLNGTKTPWFTKKSNKTFQKWERCYVKHIENAPKARDYSRTPLEYQADALGMNSLLKAYQKAAKRSSVYLGNVKGFTRDQLFYIAKCLIWCEYDQRVAADGLPPWDETCNVPLMNSEHFSKTFACRENSPMNPPEKCPFW